MSPAAPARVRAPLALLAALCTVGMPGVAAGLGLHYEPAPWYAPTLRGDTTAVAITTTVSEADSESVVMFGAEVAPLRYRAFEFAARWSYIVLRDDVEHHFAFGDPKLYARIRVPAPRDSIPPDPGWTGAVEVSARLPTAQASMFPYALGAQEIELQGVFGWAADPWTFVGVGRIWTEPPSKSDIGSQDVPHSTHVWLHVAPRFGRTRVEGRVDVFLFEIQGKSRSVYTARVAHTAPNGFDLALDVAVEGSPDDTRIFDVLAALRFATRFD
jgi:hypothetical protein